MVWVYTVVEREWRNSEECISSGWDGLLGELTFSVIFNVLVILTACILKII